MKKGVVRAVALAGLILLASVFMGLLWAVANSLTEPRIVPVKCCEESR